MVWTNYGFQVIRDWVAGTNPVAPSGMLVGTGSATPALSDTLLGSPLDPTRRGFESLSGLGFTVQFEHLVRSGDIITGSIIREIGLIAVSGGNVLFRERMSPIELLGSVEVNNFLTLTIK